MIRILGWLAAVMALAIVIAVATVHVTTPSNAAAACMTWEDGVHTAARYSHDNDDRIAAVLLTPEETAAVWPILFKGKGDAPVRFGVMVSQSQPEVAFVAGFDANGCLVGSGSIPFGPVLDAMVAAKVASEFVILAPEAPGVGA